MHESQMSTNSLVWNKACYHFTMMSESRAYISHFLHRSR